MFKMWKLKSLSEQNSRTLMFLRWSESYMEDAKNMCNFDYCSLLKGNWRIGKKRKRIIRKSLKTKIRKIDIRIIEKIIRWLA